MKVSLAVTVLCVLLLAVVSIDVNVPPAGIAFHSQNMSAAEDRQRLMDLLHLPTPGPFPPAAEDPSRPQATFQRGGSSNWYDEAGNTYVRSNWGKWSNYDETVANPYQLPDALILKNGRPVKSRVPIEVRFVTPTPPPIGVPRTGEPPK